MTSTVPTLYAPLFAGVTFVGILVLIEVGRRLGIRRLSDDTEGARTGLGPVEGAVFGLLGLMIAFTFSGAATRFDGRRELITSEANSIGTVWLRIDLLPAGSQSAMRDLLRRYLDARLGAYQKLPDLAAANVELERANQLQGEIWSQAVTACREQNFPAAPTSLFLSSLNDMIDITTTRAMSTLTHPPLIIFFMLAALALATSLLAGFAMAGARRRSWIHIVGFAAITALTIYVIIDLEYPRFGLIRIDAFDQVLVDLRKSMK